MPATAIVPPAAGSACHSHAVRYLSVVEVESTTGLSSILSALTAARILFGPQRLVMTKWDLSSDHRSDPLDYEACSRSCWLCVSTSALSVRIARTALRIGAAQLAR